MVADIILAWDSQTHINQQSEVTFRSLFVNSPPSKGACGSAQRRQKDEGHELVVSLWMARERY